MNTRHTLLLFASLAALVPATASADVVPMDVTACDMHSVGAACMDTEGSGFCAMDTCHRLDYAHWDRDASTSPPSMAYDCVRCVVGGPIDAGPSAGDGGHVDMTAPPRGNCSASPARTGGGLAWLALSALALMARRRR